MKKRLEGLLVAIAFLAVIFLVYRDVSQHAIVEIGGSTSGADVPAARTAVEGLCQQNGGCSKITYLTHVPESENVYEQVAYLVTINDKDSAIVVVSLEGGRVVRTR
jgi:hypothetical protein